LRAATGCWVIFYHVVGSEEGGGRREEGGGRREEGGGRREEGGGRRDEGRGTRDEGGGRREEDIPIVISLSKLADFKPAFPTSSW
jgi:hypothetical protein